MSDEKPKSQASPAPAQPPQADPGDRTNPGGPPPEVLVEARREAAEADQPVLPSPGDATLIYDKNKRRPASESPRLLVVAGPRNGTEFTVTEAETSIGRGSDSTVVIPDISVSRRHVVIAREGDQYLLLDQGSGNGTKVNGRNVERHVLASGDEIAMGDTVVRFLEAGGVVVKPKSGRLATGPAAPIQRAGGRASLAAQEPPEDTHASKKPAKTGAGAGLKGRAPLYAALAIVLVVVLVVGGARKRRVEQEASEAARAHLEGRALAQQRFEEGVRLLKEGRWLESRDKLRVAGELAPGDADIKRYLERAESEAPRAQAINAARAAMQKRDFAGAKGQLAGVPEDSALAEAAHDLGQQLKAAMDAAVREARSKMEGGDAARADALLDPVLAAEPARADAVAVKDAITGARRGERAERAPKKERPAPEPQAPPPPPPSIGAILDAYLAGDIGAALDKADAGTDARSQRLSHDLKAFDAAWREGLAKTQAKNLGAAIHALEQADKIDKGIAPSKESKLGREVRKALGNLHYNLGVQAMSQEGALGEAATHLRASLAADPENEGSRRHLAEVNDRAKEMYQRAYFEKDSEPELAKKAFRQVADALPANDELGLKARRWAEKLDGKTSE